MSVCEFVRAFLRTVRGFPAPTIGDGSKYKPKTSTIAMYGKPDNAQRTGGQPLRRAACAIYGEGGIRTPGRLRVTGFQDRRLKPLGHLSSYVDITSRGLTRQPLPPCAQRFRKCVQCSLCDRGLRSDCGRSKFAMWFWGRPGRGVSSLGVGEVALAALEEVNSKRGYEQAGL